MASVQQQPALPEPVARQRLSGPARGRWVAGDRREEPLEACQRPTLGASRRPVGGLLGGGSACLQVADDVSACLTSLIGIGQPHRVSTDAGNFAVGARHGPPGAVGAHICARRAGQVRRRNLFSRPAGRAGRSCPRGRGRRRPRRSVRRSSPRAPARSAARSSAGPRTSRAPEMSSHQPARYS